MRPNDVSIQRSESNLNDVIVALTFGVCGACVTLTITVN
jgi:hypothetical protein